MLFRARLSSILILSLVTYAVCVAIPPQAPPLDHLDTHQKRDKSCGFSGNSDLYGLGIRLGVYFQWASALIIYGWYPEGRKDLAESYLVFLFAITIAIIVITARSEPTYSAEILILTYIIFGGLYTVMSIGFRQHHRNRIEKSSTHNGQGITLLLISASATIYCSWFWLYGIHHNVLETPCGTFGFLFAKVSLYNENISNFFAALSIMFAYTYGAIIFYLMVVLVLFFLRVPRAVRYVEVRLLNRRIPEEPAAKQGNPAYSAGEFLVETNSASSRHKRWRKKLGEFFLPIPKMERPASPSASEPPKKTDGTSFNQIIDRLLAPGLSIFSLVYSVIGIEMTIYWNSIRDVYTINTTGQLIPFVIGLAGLIKVFYEPVKIWYKKRNVVLEGEDGENDSLKRAAQEADEANHRLDYLDLSKPVGESTVRNVSSLKRLRRRQLLLEETHEALIFGRTEGSIHYP